MARTQAEQREYMRQYRARKRQEEHVPPGATAAPTSIHAACDQRIAALQAEIGELRRDRFEAARGEVRAATAHLDEEQVATQVQAHVAAVRERPDFLRAPDDDCGACGHGWHNVEDGCKSPVATTGRPRPCGCKAYHAGPLF